MNIEQLQFNEIRRAVGHIDGGVYQNDGTTPLFINMSDIYSHMIREAGKLEAYNSDIIYTINEINEKLIEMANSEEDGYCRVYAGMRDTGIDEITSLMVNDKSLYRAIYCVTIIKEEQQITAILKTNRQKYWVEIEKKFINSPEIFHCEKILAENGVEEDETDTVLQAIGYVLLDVELYPED